MWDKDNDELLERLPLTIIPTHYDLTIRPFLDTFKFNGNIIIDIQVWFCIITKTSVEFLLD
jgi:hypothetical protein